MRIADFIIALKEQQIDLEVQEGNLKISVPKGSEVLTPALKQQIRDQKAAIIEFFSKTSASRFTLDIPQVTLQPDYAMSRSQKRFWVLNQLGESALVYNMCRSLMLEGTLDVPLLNKALQYVVGRHESLRTLFRENESGEVRQYILPVAEMPLVSAPLDISTEPAPEATLKAIAEKEQLTPFDLRKSPPLRVKLVKVKENLYAFYYTMYHIISDGWSMEVLGREVITAYNTFKQGVQPQLPPLLFQYKDYTAWLENSLHQEGMNAAEKYWREQLSGELPVLDLPADNVRPVIKTHAGASLSKTLNPAMLHGLKLLCQQEGCTLFMGLLAGINTLFYRYTNQEDIIIGTPIAGREFGELENQIGLYLNTLALRTRFNAADTFSDLLKRQKQVVVDAYHHQSYPLDMLIAAVQPNRDMSRSPLFDVLVVSQIREHVSQDMAGHNFDGLQVSSTGDTDTTISEFDLLFNFSESDNELHLSLTYNTDIYSQRNMEMLCLHLEQLILAAIADPGKSIGQLDYLTENEKNTLLVSLNSANVNYPAGETIITLFEQQVKKTPAGIAVDAGGITLTYQALNEQANALAHYLHSAQQITPDKPVGLLMDRSAQMPVAILGILKAGGAYVPIDPLFPEERANYMIADAGINLVLTDGHPAGAHIHTAAILNIAALPLDAFPVHNPETVAAPENLAYIIYTSGTTGNPKGVMIEHRNVVRLFFNEASLFNFTDKDVWTLFHSYNFDFSVWEMYGALLYGGRLIVVPQEVSKDTHRFWKMVREKGVTVLNQTPSAFYNLMEVALEDDYEITRLQYVIFGGEALQPQKLEAWKNRYPAVRLINMYGITETTVHTTYKEITLHEITAATSNIGIPIPTVGIYILDQQQQLLPLGVPGEICIHGAGLARGYINQPRLTEEKFIADPYRAGERLYRSGDVGRWLPDGNIEYVGRRDHQVKIRGYRIETGEIEIALLRHAAIKAALVIALQEQGGNSNYLAAYVIAEEPLDNSELRAWLAATLPDYMVPAWFIQLDKLPLTVNGKIDRKALPDPVAAGMTSQEFKAPVTAFEITLANIWEDVLGRDAVGLQDNFFELGGHSLKAMQVISRVQQELKLKMELRHFFEYPLLEEFAGAIAKVSRNEWQDIAPVAPQEYYDLSYAQRSIWLLSQFEERKIAYNISSVLQFDGDLDIPAFKNSLNILVDRHETLRTTFVSMNGEPKQQIHAVSPDWTGFVYTDLRNSADQETLVSSIKKAEINKPFRLDKGPLLSVQLLHLEERRFIFLFTIHHLICDGWSLDLLVEEVSVLYNSCREKKPHTLLPLRLQYKDYAAWEKNRLTPAELEEAKIFWGHHFKGGIKPVSLLGSKTTAITRNFKGASHTFRLDNHLKQGLEQLERKHNVTLFALMLSIFNVFLSKLGKEEDIAVLCASAGRDVVDLEKILGVFVKTFGIRNYPSGDKKFTDFLSEVMDRYLEVNRYSSYPFELLMDDLNQVKQSGNIGNVYFQIDNFSSFETKKEKPGLQDVVVSPLFNEAATAKADLMLYITQNPDEWYITFEYKTDLLSKGKIELWSLWLRNLISQVLANPQQQLGAYQLSNGREQELYNLLHQSKEEIIQLYPLSARQEDFYLNCKILPNETAHRVIFYTVETSMDADKWLEAISVVNEIFPILKTKVIENEGDVYQGIRDKITINAEQIDLSALNLREEQLKEELGKYTTIDHALDKELVKYFLIKINDHCFVNLLSIHHLISDVTSSVIFFRRFDEVYGKKSDEIPAAIYQQYQYHDYVLNNLHQFDTEAITSYWKGKLQDVTPVTSNVFEKITEESIEEKIIVAPEHMAQISSYCREHSISEALYFRALYSIVVRLYAVPDGNFIINDITHGRDALTKDTFGCFTAILPLVYENHIFSASVKDYLFYLKRQKKDIAGRQFLTVFLLNRLVSSIGLKFYYNYQTLYTLKEGSTKQVKVLAYFAKDEVQFSIRDTVEGLALILNYNKAYFNADGFLRRLAQVSEQLMAGTQHLNEINLQLPEEAIQFANPATAAPESFIPVHRLFEAQAQSIPKQTAIIDPQRRWTYEEVNERANSLAVYLQEKHNVGPGDLVAVIADRSAEMIIGLLGVLKAGAAYVPVDPEYPKERVSYICNNAAVKVVLTTSAYLLDMLEVFQGELFALDLQLDSLGIRKNNPELPVTAASPAYVIYTSGSTGQPKGCVVSHANLENYISWANEYYWPEKSAGNWGLCTSISFDLTVTSIYTALTRGRTLYVSGGTNIAAVLQDCFTNPEVDTLKLTPSHISLVGTLNIPSSGIKTMICGGEQLTSEQVDILLGMNPAMRIYNEYGPTETTVGCTVKCITIDDRDISIGKPVANTEILILNSEGQLLPAGIPGEIHISGAGVAVGYLDHPLLTADKFIAHPFRAAQRMYRSGDTGRWLPDGNLVYMGRKDSQVKIRGYRVEPGEIEAALLRYSKITEAVVMAPDEKDPGNLYLAAFMVATETVAVNTLREHLGQQLPDYMIPSVFVQLEKMPLTVNGKIDRRLLPEMMNDNIAGNREYVAPANETEEKLVGIWEEVLGREQISVLDNFFEIGGHSLKAMQVVSRIHKTFNVEIELGKIFEIPVLREVAEHINNDIWFRESLHENTVAFKEIKI
jgi:amino acid adenylation domain-containing protein